MQVSNCEGPSVINSSAKRYRISELLIVIQSSTQHSEEKNRDYLEVDGLFLRIMREGRKVRKCIVDSIYAEHQRKFLCSHRVFVSKTS